MSVPVPVAAATSADAVAISLAGSLFFSISPDEAKSKVFLYLVLTLAPFAVISPLLARRAAPRPPVRRG